VCAVDLQPASPAARSHADRVCGPAGASSVQKGGVVVVTAADFDYRELAQNWHASATRHALPALVLALDAPVAALFAARQVPSANLTANMVAWRNTRLQRHIQRALMERLVAATALTAAGLDVLLTDATAVFMVRCWLSIARSVRWPHQPTRCLMTASQPFTQLESHSRRPLVFAERYTECLAERYTDRFTD
jgi:hypothetical protein